MAVQGELWSEAMQVKEAQERASWHEKMSRSNIEQSEALQVWPEGNRFSLKDLECTCS